MPGLSAVDSVSQQEFDLDKYGLELLVVDTQAHHQLNDGQYEQRRRTCEQAAELLGYEHLRAVAEAVAYSTDPEGSLAAVLNCLNDETMKKRVRTSPNPAACSMPRTTRCATIMRSPCPSSTWPWTWPAPTARMAPV